jgi:glycosyltransferase involved in cell wall biosynthesis
MSSPRTIVLYNADVWQHACPVLRVIEPATTCGIEVLQGVEYDHSTPHVAADLVEESDVVVIQRDFARYTDTYQTVIDKARVYKKPVVYEIDDLLLDLPTWHPDYQRYRPVRSAILQSIMDADIVTVSTPALQRNLLQFTSNIVVLPNFLPDRIWKSCLDRSLRDSAQISPLKETPPNRLTIGYIGSSTHTPDIESIESALLNILERYKERVVLKFWGTPPPPQLRDHPGVEWEDLTLVDYTQFANYFDSRCCDLFIAPLQNCTFNNCKSHLKFLEYSAMGIPGIYSNLEPYNHIVVHGENGLLANDLDEWEKHISFLVDHPNDRDRIARKALETLRSQWLLSTNVSLWAQTLSMAATQKAHATYGYEQNVSRQWVKWHNELEHEIAAKDVVIQSMRTFQKQNASQMRRQASEMKREVDILKARVAIIENSPGWHLIQALTPIREHLIPRYSRRERFLQESIYATKVLKSEGLVPFTHRLAHRLHLSQRSPFPALLEEAHILDAVSPCPSPAISIIVIEGERAEDIDQQRVTTWCSKQTLPDTDIVTWDVRNSLAYSNNDQSLRWAAPNFKSLISGLPSRYFCIASNDLVRRSSTYLEENLITLESEALLFTVNFDGSADWANPLIEQGILPGDIEHPFLRQVVRKDVANETCTIDLTQTHANVIGKILIHTTSYFDEEGEIPFESAIFQTGYSLSVFHNYILANQAQQQEHTDAHPIYSLQTALTIKEAKSNLPTVLLYMPFLAVGGAERIALDVIQGLKDEMRFVIFASDYLAASQGTMADSFRELTPFVFMSADCIPSALNFSLLEYLLKRFSPNTLYIANGSQWIYHSLEKIKRLSPSLAIINQVYDHNAGWINLYDADLCKHLDAHIASNKNIQQAYIDRGAETRKVYYIENGINGEKWDPQNYSSSQISAIKEKLGINPKHKVISFMARLHPQKRPMDFVEIARRFSDTPNVTFLMVGDGMLKDVIDVEIWRIGLQNIVRHGFYNPAADIYAISDVMVLPSEYEGMSMMALESLCMGKPLVVTDVGNNRQMIEHTHGGIVIPNVGDIEALAKAVRQILSTPPNGERIRQAVLTHYGIAKQIALYKQALLSTNPVEMAVLATRD